MPYFGSQLTRYLHHSPTAPTTTRAAKAHPGLLPLGRLDQLGRLEHDQLCLGLQHVRHADQVVEVGPIVPQGCHRLSANELISWLNLIS